LYYFQQTGHFHVLQGEEPMKRGTMVLAVLLVIAIGVFFALRLRVAADITTAAGAETTGDYAAALEQYVDALNKTSPSLAVPDVNHSKVVSPAAWKKEMESYVAWITGAPQVQAAAADAAKRRGLLDAVKRNAARVHEDNFMSNGSRKKLSTEQFAALWNSAFFATGIKADSSHVPLAASCYSRNISFLKISALTSYVYEITLIDTAVNRRILFSVYPEGSTFILAPPGNHILVCKSSYQPGPGMIWRSTPTVIPITVPESPSLFSFTLQTRVVREKEKK
jgi:hypothetical protein